MSLAKVYFIPCGQSPLRSKCIATSATRLRMVQAAIASESRFVLDEREIVRNGPSYTIDTLAELRNQYKDHPICLILGMDAFLDLPKWHRWKELIELVHIVVAHRPGWSAPNEGELGSFVLEYRVQKAQELIQKSRGKVFIMPVTQLELSATQLRSGLQLGLDPTYLMPESVAAIIKETDCYTQKFLSNADE